MVFRCTTCRCLWRDNNDGTVSLLDGLQRSCSSCERLDSWRPGDPPGACHEVVLHPSIEHFVRQFRYAHLPEAQRRISQPFGELANAMMYSMELAGPEQAAGLRKLLEAKDCAVRASFKE